MSQIQHTFPNLSQKAEYLKESCKMGCYFSEKLKHYVDDVIKAKEISIILNLTLEIKSITYVVCFFHVSIKLIEK